MKHKRKTVAIMTVGLVLIGLTGCGLIEKFQKTPLETLHQAQAKTQTLSGIKEKITTKMDGHDIGMDNQVESVVTYEFDTKQGLIESEANGKITTLFLQEDDFYIKDGPSNQYLDLSDSLLKKTLIGMIRFPEINPEYKALQEHIMKSVTEDDVTMEKADITVQGKKEKVKTITVTLPKEKTQEMLAAYYETSIRNMMGNMIEELATFRVSTEAEITGETLSEKDKTAAKEELQTEMDTHIEKQLDNMRFSDMVLTFYLKKDLIVKQEEAYRIFSGEKITESHTMVELLEYGPEVQCPDITEKEVASLEEYLSTTEKESEKQDAPN